MFLMLSFCAGVFSLFYFFCLSRKVENKCSAELLLDYLLIVGVNDDDSVSDYDDNSV